MLSPALRQVLSGGLRPSLDLNFMNGVADGRLTISGGANGTRVNSSGVIVAATTPRIDYDPVTLACKGLLVEEARTNLFLNALLNGTSLSTQGVSLTAQAYTLSFYGTGTVTLSGASTAGPLVGSGAYPTRSTLTFTPTAGTVTFTVSGSVQYAQIEAGTFATSFIPTAGTAVTRTADSAVMTGTNFSSWFNASEGTFVFEGDLVSPTSSGNQFLARASDATYSNAIALNAANTGIPQIVTASGGVFDGAAGGVVVPTANTVFKFTGAYAANNLASSLNGATVATDATATIPSGLTRLDIGRDHAGAASNTIRAGHIRRIRYYNRRLPNATLQALTA